MLKFKPFNIDEFKKYDECYELNFNKNRTINIRGKLDNNNYYYFDIKKELIHKCDICNKKGTITKILVRLEKNSIISVNGIIHECINCEFIKKLKGEE